ncbi:MAG TPA: DNA-3-methyladenine glycosylase [Pirellulaceae bacterium]|nr:DNA-3-methyladenine glycosylase [Pirellulaceae bacterium]
MSSAPLNVDFYRRDPATVARDLIGKLLIRDTPTGVTSGRIVETEAYLAAGDTACHAARGQTPRNAAMFGPPGRAYVYAIHSRWCLNAVTEEAGIASAVLIRAIEPLVGLELMEQRRQRSKLLDLTRGPARLCEALAIDRSLDHCDLTRGQTLWIANDPQPSSGTYEIGISRRIGVTSAHDLPLRFFERGNRFVSGRRNHA